LPSPSIPKKIGFALVLLGALAGLAEVALRVADTEILRFVHQARQVHRYAVWHKVDLRPNQSAVLRLTSADGSALFDFTLVTDELALRRPVRWEDDAAPRRKRIVHCLGDSLTMGWGVEAEDAYPERLQRILGPDVRVLNLGVDGFGLLASRHKSDLVSERHPPDALVYLFWLNDFSDDALTESVRARSRLEHLGWTLIDEIRRVSYLANLPFAIKWLIYYEPARSGPSAPTPGTPPNPAEVLERAVAAVTPRNATTRELAELAEWSRRNDVPLFLVVLDDSPESVGILSAALELGIPGTVFPMTWAMRIPGDGHLNPAGNALLAEHVAEAIREATQKP
jgi:lysophospholipase L1-like esterase